jgi:hypothetical protein
MKVKFNLPISRHNSQLNYDFNSTFCFGAIQSSLCKFVVPKANFNINVSQLVSTSPLVVPTFGRMAVHNIFAYVPMSMVFPAFDAFLSQTKVCPSDGDDSYMPNSLPTITNNALVCMLLASKRYSKFCSFKVQATHPSMDFRVFEYFGKVVKIAKEPHHVPDTDEFTINYDDVDNYTYDYVIVTKVDDNLSVQSFYKLTDLGRKVYNLLRSLGYSLDYLDRSPVSALPIISYCKAVYDILYPKRDTPWHVMKMYTYINSHYNGEFHIYTFNNHSYDLFYSLPSLEKTTFEADDFERLFSAIEPFLYAPIGRNLSNIATAQPILPTSKTPNLSGVRFPISSGSLGTSSGVYDNDLIPKTSTVNGVSADSLRFADRLWSFVQRSSVVGQDVKNWFKTHFGTVPSEDMFSQSFVIRDVVNQLNVNTVVSTAETKTENSGDVLGALAGQSYAASNDKVKFESPNFGYLLCLTYVVPVCRISSGTQPELYNIGYFDMPFPDFDGLGYESLNTSSFQESDGILYGSEDIVQGFGFVPRMTSFKTINNVRSGGFALPSLRDSYLPYCLDNTVYIRPSSKNTSYKINNVDDIGSLLPLNSQTLSWYYPYGRDLRGSFDISFDHLVYSPWRIFDSIFYNVSDASPAFGLEWQVDNFMLQSSFNIDVSSYLKPISDSFEINQLGKNIVSTEKS